MELVAVQLGRKSRRHAMKSFSNCFQERRGSFAVFAADGELRNILGSFEQCQEISGFGSVSPSQNHTPFFDVEIGGVWTIGM